MSDSNRPRENRLKGKFKGMLDRLMGADRPRNEGSRPSGSRSTFTRVPEVTRGETSLNVFSGAHNFVIKDTTFYAAQKIEVHEHASGGQDDLPLVPQRPNSSALFTGREDVLKRLMDHFSSQDQVDRSRKSFLLYGMGGIGKTQICLKFVEKMAERFSHVFWIDASSEDTIALGLKGLCSHPEAKAAGVSVSSESALIWIGSLQSEWLLVFDNADGAPEVVEKFIPSGSQGNILVTSRNRSLGRVTSYENSLEVNQMAEKEAISLLLKASHLTGDVYSPAQQIVNELCCLPLAVDQAGASIEAGLCSIDNYLEHLSRHRNKLMNHPSFRGASQYNCTVYETWDLSFNEIESRANRKSDGHGRAAAQAALLILETAAFLHHENIIEAAFKKAAVEFSKGLHSGLEEEVETCMNKLLQLEEDQSWNQFFFHEGVRVLMSFSLIKQHSTSAGTYAIHPLMHQWSRDRMSISQKKCMMQVSKLILVNCITEEMTTENMAFNRLLVPHIKAIDQSQEENGFERVFNDKEYSKFSYVLYENGMWKDAEYFRNKIVEMRIKKQGPEHPDTLTGMNNLALTYSKQGKYEEAGELQLKVLDLRNRVLGPEHPDTLTSMNNLALTYSNQGKYEEAGELQLKVLDLRKRVLGPEHPATLVSMSNLAATHSKQGKYEEAAQLQLKTPASA